MRTVRWAALWTVLWTAKKGFEIGDQIHNGWLLANSDGDIRL